MKKREFLLLLLLATTFFGIYLAAVSGLFKDNLKIVSPQDIAGLYPVSDTPTPTPRRLTFGELNSLYGPCVTLPTLMYHHVQDKGSAQSKNQTSLTVYTDTFQQQMRYLAEQGYKSIYMSDLSDFFEKGTNIAPKSVLITFDDGYDDFATNALPILRQYQFNATVFVATGLMDNPGYLSWSTIKEIAVKGDISFANHTWSHKNVASSKSEVEREIKTADFQLDERGYNSPKIFAYPYGVETEFSRGILDELEYRLAFTTQPGMVACSQQRLTLPRTRVGNSPLSTYGL
jgi:peptidoglycan/xylan/chitin deacetylase (PgdA/CDA1 family)